MAKPGILLALVAFVIPLGIGTSQAQIGPDNAESVQCPPGVACPSQPPVRRKVRKPKPKQQAKPAAKQPAPLPGAFERIPYTKQERAAAVVPGMPGARFWADSFEAFTGALPKTKAPWLVLSSGGAAGAYGAGILVGMSEAGTRPEFSVVTGVSIGAIMAPYAFLGQKYDKELRDSFLTLTAADVFEDAQRADSLVDTWPLKDLLAKRVTPQILADIAAEHRKGRRLFVVTADMDSERPVLWDMGAIAEHGGEAGLKLFRDVLLAASAIPGIFPPVYIDVEANGRKFQEMHMDGGVFGPFYAAPPNWLIEPGNRQLPASQLYVIINGKLTPEFEVTGTEKAQILGRMIDGAVKAGAQAEIALLAAATGRAGIDVSLAYTDRDFHAPGQTGFDPKKMQALFDRGFELGKNGTAFRKLGSAATWQAHTKQ
jgi:predicted acylesterase/phospholipase RssA